MPKNETQIAVIIEAKSILSNLTFCGSIPMDIEVSHPATASDRPAIIDAAILGNRMFQMMRFECLSPEPIKALRISEGVR